MNWKTRLIWIFGIGLFLHAVYVGFRYAPLVSQIRFPLLEQIASGEIHQFFDYSNLPLVRSTSPEELFKKLDSLRVDQIEVAFETNGVVCELAHTLAQREATTIPDDLPSLCPDCYKTAMVRITSIAPPSMLIGQLSIQGLVDQLVTVPEYTHACVAQEGKYLTLLFASFHQLGASAPISPGTTRPESTFVTIEPKYFTEDQLMSALAEYRRAHRRSTLKKDENLCQYARHRIDQHIYQFQNRDKSDYPVPDKYPLDAHEGFRADGDSSYLFHVTKMTLVGENLAYWPTAEYPHQVIEWGWDSSTEGHREAQLSDEFDYACVSGREGFFVAIFGKK